MHDCISHPFQYSIRMLPSPVGISLDIVLNQGWKIGSV